MRSGYKEQRFLIKFLTSSTLDFLPIFSITCFKSSETEGKSKGNALIDLLVLKNNQDLKTQYDLHNESLKQLDPLYNHDA